MSNRSSPSSQHGHSGSSGRARRRRANEQRSDYVLPAATYAGSGDGRDSSYRGSASGGSDTLDGIYDRYGHGFESDSSRRGSQSRSRRGSQPSEAGPYTYYDPNAPSQRASSHSSSQRQRTSTVHTTGSRIENSGGAGGAGSRPGSDNLFFLPGSVVNSNTSRSGSNRSRVSSSSRERRDLGARTALGNSMAAAHQAGVLGQPIIRYGEGSGALRTREAVEARAGRGFFRRFFSRKRR